MYQASDVEQSLRAIMGIRAQRLIYGEGLKGPGRYPVSWLRRADRSSIFSFSLADLGGEALISILMVDVGGIT
jgi:hypothetical protein